MFRFCCGRILLASAYYKKLDSRARLSKKLALESPSGALDSRQNVRFPLVECSVVSARSNSNGPIRVRRCASRPTKGAGWKCGNRSFAAGRDRVNISQDLQWSRIGIQTLLPFQKAVTEDSHLTNFYSKVAAIDASCWIHKAISFSIPGSATIEGENFLVYSYTAVWFNLSLPVPPNFQAKCSISIYCGRNILNGWIFL